MRSLLAALPLLICPAPAAAAAADGAAALFAERTALLAADAACAVLASPVRAALAATAIQARAEAFYAGWTPARLDGVAVRAAAAGRARPCADPEIKAAAQRAQAGYAGWAQQHEAHFAGASRAWAVRRTPDPEGFLLVQRLDGARFGLRDEGLTAVLEWGGAPPVAARLSFRDSDRATRPLTDIPGRAAQGLAAGAPSPEAARTVLARARAVAGAQARFTFPDATLRALALLDPRESVVLEVTPAKGPPVRLYIEVGGLAAACAFLAAKPL